MTIDIDAAVADIGASLGFGEEPEESSLDAGDPPVEATPPVAAPDTAAPSQEGAEAAAAVPPQNGAAAPAVPAVRPPPKSWAKDYHEDWAKLTPKQQEYIEKREKDFLDGTEQYRGDAGFAKEVKDLLTPYRAMYNADGVSPTEAIQRLLNAEYQLRSGTPEQRAYFYQQLGRDLGVLPEQPADPNAPPPDPRFDHLTQAVQSLQSERAQERDAALRGRYAEALTKIEAFSRDPKNEHFNEVAPQMKPWIEAGYSIEDAYDAAVHANPVTREKAFAKRLTVAEAERQEKLRKEGQDAKAATSVNVKGVESHRTPTETKGKFLSDSELRSDLKKIRERSH